MGAVIGHLGARVVIRHPYVGKSRPSVTQAEAPRWPITAPMSALSAARAGRWPRHGPRGPMGSVGSGLAPLGPARHLPGPTIGLRGASDGPFRPAGPGTPGVRGAACDLRLPRLAAWLACCCSGLCDSRLRHAEST